MQIFMWPWHLCIVLFFSENRDSIVSKYSNWELLLRPVVELSSRGFFNSNIVFLSSVSIDINYISLESPILFACFDLHFYFRYLFSYFSFPCSHCVFFFPSGMSRALCMRKTNWRTAGPRKKCRNAATATTRCCWRRSKSTHRALFVWHLQLNTTLHHPEKNKRNEMRAIKQMSPRERERFARVPTVVNHGRNARATIAKKKTQDKNQLT